MRVKSVSETKPEEMNESQCNASWARQFGPRWQRRVAFTLSRLDRRLIRLVSECIKRALGEVVL